MCTTPPSGATPPVLSGIQANSSAPLGGPSSATAPSALGALGGSGKAPTNESVQDLLARVAEAVKKLQELIAGMMGPGQGPVDPGQGPLDPTQVGQLGGPTIPQNSAPGIPDAPAYGSTTPISIPAVSAPETIAASKAMIQTRRAEIAQQRAKANAGSGTAAPEAEGMRADLATKELDRFEQLLTKLGPLESKVTPLANKVLASIGEDLATKGTYDEAAGFRLITEISSLENGQNGYGIQVMVALTNDVAMRDQMLHKVLAQITSDASTNGAPNAAAMTRARLESSSNDKLRAMIDRIEPAMNKLTPQIGEMASSVMREIGSGRPFNDATANAVYTALGV